MDQTSLQIPGQEEPLARRPEVAKPAKLKVKSKASKDEKSGRRRISRACDQCHLARTKCDGQKPCASCLEYGMTCMYLREQKRRGKGSWKYIREQQQLAAASAENNFHKPQSPRNDDSDQLSLPEHPESPDRPMVNTAMIYPPWTGTAMSPSSSTGSEEMSFDANPKLQQQWEMDLANHQMVGELQGQYQQFMADVQLNPSLEHGLGGPAVVLQEDALGQKYGYNREDIMFDNGVSEQGDTSPSMLIYGNWDGTTDSLANNSVKVKAAPSPFFGDTQLLLGYPQNTTAPLFRSLTAQATSPQNQHHNHTHMHHNPPPSIRYPVLAPILPHIRKILSASYACELLDYYFTSSSFNQIHPISPYVLGYVFRKESFLRQDNPRKCAPALLASILWISAHSSDAPFLTTPPSARSRICKQLLNLIHRLLKPHIDGVLSDGAMSHFAKTLVDGKAINSIYISPDGTNESGTDIKRGCSNGLDDVMTYVHLATVSSASEYKGASLHWWNEAWTLARRLKLGREVPTDLGGQNQLGIQDAYYTETTITEEAREERRRVWWLLYVVDRHLSLCYNKPLFLLDAECDQLLQPMDDKMWQIGDFASEPQPPNPPRRRGPSFGCTGHSIFGYFLPLMTILGEIVDLKHARNHPRFGLGFQAIQRYANEIATHLDIYKQSLNEFEQRYSDSTSSAMLQSNNTMDDSKDTASSPSSTPSSSSISTTDLQTRIVLAYATHVHHVLHILVSGKWDPISLLEDEDLWTSTSSFLDATSHAIHAAEAVEKILDLDPGLEFMPFFFGVYLLQGSLLLLLIADKLGCEASPGVVNACEIIVRAHEASVVTLRTEYQRNFRTVMRSALAQVRGRESKDPGEQSMKRRQILGLYRWNADGTGLAL
ncbi:fungal-specific transcription factor domain-containing protein [Xylogone sp. PMI_703]|nr:fungal-specific transcription factor domain-containing protein [Xylogone sp. PMI_703]